MKKMQTILSLSLIVLLFAGCAANFGTGQLIQNTAGAQAAATGKAEIDNADVEDGGTLEGSPLPELPELEVVEPEAVEPEVVDPVLQTEPEADTL